MAVVPARSFARQTQRFVFVARASVTRRAASCTASQVAATARRLADPAPHGRQVRQPTDLAMGHRFVYTGLGYSGVNGGVAGHHPMRHDLGHQQRQPFHAAEQCVGRHHHVQMQVV